MFKSYFKTAFRFLKKNKTFSFINIVGLAIGTLCCLYILLYVQEQYSYDKHYQNAADIYRINSFVKNGGDERHSAAGSPPIAPAMKNDFSEVQQFTRVVVSKSVNQHLLHYKEKSMYEKEAVFVDSTFFDIFTYHFIYGDPAGALTAPYSVVLIKATADKLFGNIDPVGQLIKVDNASGIFDFKVTGVVDESLGKSHIHANMFFTMNSGGLGDFVRNNDSWATNNFAYAYVKLYPNTNVTALEKKLPAFLSYHGQQQLKSMGMEKTLHLQPVSSIHTTTDYVMEFSKTVSPSFLYLLLLIAALIQLIACINFMNLSTARASKRAKEVGMRKVMGADRKDLIQQFLGESLLLSLIGVLVALPLLLLALPYLNQITQADIQLSFLTDYRLWLVMATLIITTGLLAGSYPAFYLSAFGTIKVIRGNFTNHISAAGIRRSLVVFQFVLSIVLISGIIVIYSQLNYIKNKDLGFEKEQQLVFSFHTNDAKSKMAAFVNDLRQLPEIKAVGRANNYPSQFVYNDIDVYLAGGNAANFKDAQYMLTDEYFAKATGIKLVSGRDFRQQDSTGILINETLAKQLGIDPATAEGIRLFAQPSNIGPPFSIVIAGVMKDFNYNSLHENVRPFMLMYDTDPSDFSHVIVNTGSKNYRELLGKIGRIWQSRLPDVPFEYKFMDDEVQKQYETEITLSRIINSFTLMAIIISCLGLFGLAAFSAEQRRKEIGIRKALGSSVSGIVQLLSKDFLKLVFIAIVIAIPIAWWAMNQWLQAYVYRIEVSWWMFAAAGMLAIFISICTISFQAVNAALANPVKSLRSE
ncbi:putative ABC transport system permease protein [Chitinophaga niastensis]|uniref:Putative ABC transport system permease protein n=1 Tax=Chitinophaga niastensis TaxID=536980 RepID=A0A2P8H9G4_CHINA|nr:ABC transporter permease [Chitinophaga niastensis]PSL42876.1 putative ABC transport system permease protein [Chitinophaga niastensis]